MAAVHGNGFCTSASLAVKTIVTNVLRVAAVDTVGDALVFLGKLSVMAGCGAIALLMSSLTYYTDPVKYPNTFLSSALLPVILSLLVAYIVASIFFNVRTCSWHIIMIVLLMGSAMQIAQKCMLPLCMLIMHTDAFDVLRLKASQLVICESCCGAPCCCRCMTWQLTPSCWPFVRIASRMAGTPNMHHRSSWKPSVKWKKRDADSKHNITRRGSSDGTA